MYGYTLVHHFMSINELLMKVQIAWVEIDIQIDTFLVKLKSMSLGIHRH